MPKKESMYWIEDDSEYGRKRKRSQEGLEDEESEDRYEGKEPEKSIALDIAAVHTGKYTANTGPLW